MNIKSSTYLIIWSSLLSVTGCGSTQNGATPTDPTEPSVSTISPATTQPETADWVMKNARDGFVAPWAQTVCDTLDTWKAPAETTSSEVADFKTLLSNMRDLMGKPSDQMWSDTYLMIYSIGEAALKYESKYPKDIDRPFTISQKYHHMECHPLKLVFRNSKFGVTSNGEMLKSDIPTTTTQPILASQTTTASETIVPRYAVDSLDWNPCKSEIGVSISFGNFPRRYRGLVVDAMQIAVREISQLSGLDLVYLGLSKETPTPKRAFSKNANAILIAFVPPGKGLWGIEVEKFARVIYTEWGTEEEDFLQSDVVVNSNVITKNPKRAESKNFHLYSVRKSLMMSIGLRTVQSKFEIMGSNDSNLAEVSDFGPGDRLGLAAVKTENKCE
jgi:hypothetical protein